MIHVQRSPAPEILNSSLAQQERKRATEVFTRLESLQRSFNFAIFRSKEVKDALLKLFHGKCAFCESRIETAGPMDFEHFRPKNSVMNLEGKSSFPGYWWLASDWNNLYAACAYCNRSKGNRFPLADESKRAKHPGQEALEEPLLLDPCLDQPGEHLLFSDDGLVAPRTPKARVTIEVFGLNRSGLVHDRQVLAKTLSAQMTRIAHVAGGRHFPSKLVAKEIKVLSSFTDAEQPYSGMCQQLVARWIDDNKQSRAIQRALQQQEQPAASASAIRLTKSAETKVFQEFRVEQSRQESFSVENPTQPQDYFIKTRLIEKVEIDNFKAIEHLEISFTGSPSNSWPWRVLLGENGAGKSSVLEALALTLGGNKHSNSIGLNASHFVCNNTNAPAGSVRVFLTGNSVPITMTFNRTSTRFEHSDQSPKVLLLAYGAVRLLPRETQPFNNQKEFVKIANLFSPFVPLSDPDDWLANLNEVSEKEFQDKKEALKQFLPLRETDDIIRDKGKLHALVNGVRLSLKQLSAGYQSVIALASDMFRVLRTHWEDVSNAEGIVLVDEIGEHLHPTWKKKVVRDFRSVFPRVQFVVTTHDPLCLRGIFGGEVVLMRRSAKNSIYTLTDLPPVECMRIEQILTSEYFGLNSVYDDEADALFREYYALLGLRNWTRKQKARIKELRNNVEKSEVLGVTRRERLMLNAIDSYLAKESEVMDQTGRRNDRAKLDSKLSSILG